MEPNAITTENEGQSSNTQLSLIDLEEYTVKTLGSLEGVQVDLKKHNQMLADGYNNTPEYREHDEKVKEAQKAKARIKKEIDKTPGNQQLIQKIKNLRYEIKERKQTLSGYAIDFVQVAGTDQIEKDGQVYTIVKSARLVKVSKKL